MLPTLLVASLASAGQVSDSTSHRGQRHAPAASQVVSRDAALWEQIATLRQGLTVRPPGSGPFAGALEKRRTLLGRVRQYLALYPGGTHRDEAIRLELTTLFELAVLTGDDLARLEARVREYLRNPPSQAALHEAAYWAILCERQRRPPATQPGSIPFGQIDAALRAAYEEYFQRYPTSRYAPRVATILFEAAQRRGDRAEMRRLVKRLSEAFPDHATAAFLAARLRRADALGNAFWTAFDTPDGTPVDTRDLIGQPLLIVVWAGFDAAARQCAAEVEAYRRRHPQLNVVGVNLDATVAQMTAACRALRIDWPQFNDGLGRANRFARRWGVRQIPRVFVVDRAGRLLGAADERGWRQLADRALQN